MAAKRRKITVLYVGPDLEAPSSLLSAKYFKSSYGNEYELIKVPSAEEALKKLRKTPVNMIIYNIALGIEIEGKLMDMPTLNFMKEAARISPKTHLALINPFQLFRDRRGFQKLPKDVELFEIPRCSEDVERLGKRIRSLKEKPWRDKPARIDIKTGLTPLIHVTPGGYREDVIHLCKAYKEKPDMRKMIEMGWRPSDFDPAGTIRRRLQSKVIQGQLSKRELETMLKIHDALLKAQKREKQRGAKPKRPRHRRPR